MYRSRVKGKGFVVPRSSGAKPLVPLRKTTTGVASKVAAEASTRSDVASSEIAADPSPQSSSKPVVLKRSPLQLRNGGTNATPSSGPPAKQKKRFSVPSQSASAMAKKAQESEASDVPWKYFSAVWCKFSRKKHKTWEGDALLMVRGKVAILKDLEGKDIAKSTTLRASDTATLVEGETLLMSSKQVEVMGTISEEDWQSGKCFVGATQAPAQRAAMARPSAKPFKSVQNKSGATKSTPVVLKPRFNPDAEGAFVLYRPKSAKEVAVVVDPHLSVHLRHHQFEGVQFLWDCITGARSTDGMGCILGDEMGLGKTLQTITLMYTALKQGPTGKALAKRGLVVCPGSLVSNWKKEFRKWLGNERIKVYAVSSANPIESAISSPIYSVIIMSYEMFLRNISKIESMRLDLLVCDEAHRLKNSASKTALAMKSLSVFRRVALTGTPIQNDLQEFFAIVDFCNPGCLGTTSTFRRVYEEPILASRQPSATKQDKTLGKSRGSELSRKISAFCLRRTKEVNYAYLPAKNDYVVFCKPSKLQLDLYQKLLGSRSVRTCLQGSLANGLHLVVINSLKMLCNSPRLLLQAATIPNDSELSTMSELSASLNLQEEEVNDVANPSLNGKLMWLADMLKYWRADSAKERVLVVSNSTKCLDRINEFCDLHKYPVLRLQGSTPMTKRMEIVDRFNNRLHDDFIMLMSCKAGGVGLNIVGASRLVLYDTDWNPANDLQAMARVWRDGQKRKVFIYRLLTTGTIEEKIYQRQVHKQGLCGTVVDSRDGAPQQQESANFALNDLKDIFSLHEETVSDTYELLERCGGAGAKSKSLSLDELLTWKRLASPFDTSELDDDALRQCNPDLYTCVFESQFVPGTSTGTASSQAQAGTDSDKASDKAVDIANDGEGASDFDVAQDESMEQDMDSDDSSEEEDAEPETHPALDVDILPQSSKAKRTGAKSKRVVQKGLAQSDEATSAWDTDSDLEDAIGHSTKAVWDALDSE
eukprot:m.334362 g.334362  ORF g.334362 m.334362 type:complete len:990 (+) comp16070_c2_seq1:659-3628(+)